MGSTGNARFLRAPRDSRELAETFPERGGAVDVAILRTQKRVHHARQTRVRDSAGHAGAAAVDAIENDIAPRRTARRDPRHRALVSLIAIVEIDRISVLHVATVDPPPEIERLFGRPEARHRKAAGA